MGATRTINQAKIVNARAFSAEELHLSVVADEDEMGDPFSRISSFANSEWFHRDYPFWVTSMTDFLEEGHIAPRLVFIGEHGEFIDFSKPDEIDMGLSADTRESKGLGDGYLYCVKQIGKHLYACGMAGQNYKRWENGTWQILDKNVFETYDPEAGGELFDRLVTDTSLADSEEFLGQLLESITDKSTKDYQYITGLAEDSIYMCGGKGNLQSALTHNTGDGFKPLRMDSPVFEENSPSLNHILFEDGEDRIRVCGQRGTMLMGNARDGFVQDPVAVEDIIYYNMAMFQDRIYFASTIGLLVHTGDEIRRVLTGLEPDAIDTHTVQAVDDVLWVVGIKDILRFDGKTWERIPYPGNNPL